MFKHSDLRAKRRTKNHTKARHSSHEAAIVEHVSRHLARPAFVIHEIESELVHLDVHVVPPAPDRNFWFLFTTGMSARPMRKPHDAQGSRLAELSILLPQYWRLDRESWRDTRWCWPIRELKEAALMPHRHDTWLGYGHTIMPTDVSRAGEVTRSLDTSTRLSSLLVVASDLVPEETELIKNGAARIDLLTLFPIYPEELDYKVEHGLDALMAAFSAAGVSDVIDPARPSAVASAN